MLTADLTFGTLLRGHPLMWPLGYRAEHNGPRVTIRDAKGNVVATTGRVYYFAEARVGDPDVEARMHRLDAYPVSADCGYAWSFVDCTAVAQINDPAGPDSPLGEQRASCSTIGQQ